MKIRTGFVSNSSSSSFCVVGIKENIPNVKSDEFREFIKDLWRKCDAAKTCRPVDANIGLSLYEGYVIIGTSIKEMKGHETLDEFYEMTRHDLEEVFQRHIDISELNMYADGGYAG